MFSGKLLADITQQFYLSLKINIQVLYTEFLRHSSMTAQIRHTGVAVGNFTYSVQVSYILSPFTQ